MPLGRRRAGLGRRRVAEPLRWRGEASEMLGALGLRHQQRRGAEQSRLPQRSWVHPADGAFRVNVLRRVVESEPRI